MQLPFDTGSSVIQLHVRGGARCGYENGEAAGQAVRQGGPQRSLAIAEHDDVGCGLTR